MKALMVSTDMVRKVWGDVSKILLPAAQLFDGYTMSDIYRSLLSADSILWLAVDDDKTVHAAMVVRIVQYPRKRTCLLRLVAGKDSNEWLHLFKDIEDWAAALGCNDIEFIGRSGWSRLLVEFESPARLYRKQIGGG